MPFIECLAGGLRPFLRARSAPLSPQLRWVPGFATYQWGKPQLGEVENAEGARLPRR